MFSASSPSPGSTDQQNGNKYRIPHQRQFQTQPRYQEQQDTDWNNTRKSMSAGAVLCSNNVQRPLPNVGSGDRNHVGAGKLGFSGSDDFHNPQTGHFTQNSEQPHPTFSTTQRSSSASFKQQNFPEMDFPIWLGEPIREMPKMPMGIQATSHGFISLLLRGDVRIDITVDKAIRCISNSKGIIVCVNSQGNMSAMLHPCGKLYQYGKQVEVTTTNPLGYNKYVKMWYKGVSFNSEHAALTYLVDNAGTRTTMDAFSDIHDDFTLPIFLKDSMHGPVFIPECMRQIEQAEYRISDQGNENWTVNGIRISRTVDGLVRVSRGQGKWVLRISPQEQLSSLTTPGGHASTSLGNNGRECHVFVKRGSRRLQYDGTTLIVRNKRHAAGFDETGHLKVY